MTDRAAANVSRHPHFRTDARTVGLSAHKFDFQPRVAVAVVPVATWTAVIVAFGTTAPAGSVTTPVSVPWPVWPKAQIVDTNRAIESNRNFNLEPPWTKLTNPVRIKSG